MGNRSSLPKYEEITNEEFFYEEQEPFEDEKKPCALEKLNKIFDDIINTPIFAIETIEGKIFKLIVAAKSYGLIIPVKLLLYTEYIELTNEKKTEYIRFNLGLISEWLGKNWILT